MDEVTNLFIGLGLAVITGLIGFMLGRVVERRDAPAPRAAFDVELAAHLKRNDYSLITREQVDYLGIPVIKNPAVPPDTAVFVNPDTLTKWVDDWQKTFKGTGNAHRVRDVTDELRDCGRRWGTAGTPGHCCVIPAKFHGPKCVCDCGVTTPREEAEPKGEGA